MFIRQLEVLGVGGRENLLCRLRRGLCGLKQSPRCLDSALDDYLKKLGYPRSSGDSCTYASSDGEMVVGVCIGDIIVAGKTEKTVDGFGQALDRGFGVKDLRLLYAGGGAHGCCGCSGSGWAGDLNAGKSASGYIFMLCGAGISWRGEKQASVALSIAEAGFVALGLCRRRYG